MSQTTDDLIDIRAAARSMQRSEETIRRWIWAGRLPVRRVGRRLMIARSDLEAVRRPDQRVAGSLAA